MSKTDNENTKPIKPARSKETPPISADESWLTPVEDEGATIPVKVARKKKAQSGETEPINKVEETVVINKTPAKKTKKAATIAVSSTEDTVPLSVAAEKKAGKTAVEKTASTDDTLAIPVTAVKKPRKTAVQPSTAEGATVPLAPTRKATSQTVPAAVLAAANSQAPGGHPPADLAEIGANANSALPGNDEKPPAKSSRTKVILLGILAMIIIILLGAGVGYASAIRARMVEQENQRLVLASTQFELGLADQREGRLDTARKRFEYVLSIYPDFPGVADKLVEVGLAIGETQVGQIMETEPSPGGDTVITPVATKDTTSVSILFNQAQNQLNAKDWDGLFTTLEKMRYIDPEYEPVKTDGKLYLALRNRGISQIQAGSLEPGLFSFAMATQIAPIDEQAESYATWARMYLKAASFGLVDEFLAESVRLFSELHALVPNLRDSSGITVSQRYAQALVNLGLFYQRNQDYCGAVPYFHQARGIFPLPSLTELIPRAEELCNNPPEATAPPSESEAPTETPVATPEPTAEPTP